MKSGPGIVDLYFKGRYFNPCTEKTRKPPECAERSLDMYSISGNRRQYKQHGACMTNLSTKRLKTDPRLPTTIDLKVFTEQPVFH